MEGAAALVIRRGHSVRFGFRYAVRCRDLDFNFEILDGQALEQVEEVMCLVEVVVDWEQIVRIDVRVI